MKTLPTESWHHLEIEEAARVLETDRSTGLTGEDVLSRRQGFGENTLTQKVGQGPIIRFLLQFNVRQSRGFFEAIIMAFEFFPRIGNCETPGNCDRLIIALFDTGQHLSLKLVLERNAPIQALAGDR